MMIDLKNLDDSSRVIGTIDRKPRDHVGWQSIRYKKKRYQLHGGVRANYFINITNPIQPPKSNDR